jgi:hypothetical protein
MFTHNIAIVDDALPPDAHGGGPAVVGAVRHGHGVGGTSHDAHGQDPRFGPV